MSRNCSANLGEADISWAELVEALSAFGGSADPRRQPPRRLSPSRARTSPNPKNKKITPRYPPQNPPFQLLLRAQGPIRASPPGPVGDRLCEDRLTSAPRPSVSRCLWAKFIPNQCPKKPQNAPSTACAFTRLSALPRSPATKSYNLLQLFKSHRRETKTTRKRRRKTKPTPRLPPDRPRALVNSTARQYG
jgi:hypothetical protein